jgi:hypothetical protein
MMLGHMMPHDVFTDLQVFRDLFVRVTERKQVKDLELA